jgi:hypothetical protein
LAVANTLIGLGLSETDEPATTTNTDTADGSSKVHLRRGVGNEGAAGIVLTKGASDASIGVDAPDAPVVYIAGNAGAGVQAAGSNLHVVNTAIGLDQKGFARCSFLVGFWVVYSYL